jgi:hypothetical protein
VGRKRGSYEGWAGRGEIMKGWQGGGRLRRVGSEKGGMQGEQGEEIEGVVGREREGKECG